MNQRMYCKIIVCTLFGFALLLTWSAASGYTRFNPVKSSRFFSYLDFTDELHNITLNGGSIKLLGSTEDYVYLGGINCLYRVSWSSLGSLQLVAAVGSAAQPVTVKYLYILGNPPTAAFVCNAMASTASTAPQSTGCQLFNVTSQLPWQPIELTNRQISPLLTGFLMPNSASDPARVSLRLNGSHAFISNYPQMHDTLDIIELRWPRFDKIGWLTADFMSRRNREPWISRLARPVAMATRGEKLYTLFTEDAFEASNYFSSVSGEAFRTSAAIVKLPRFTRLARICLNDPGSQPASQDIRVMTSFFKMRLICRNGSVDYDVLELVTEVSPSSPGAFYGLFSIQNSPSPSAHRAVCRFTLDSAESLISSSDFIQLEQSGLLSYNAKRLSRADFAEASGRPRPTACDWTTDEAKQLKLSNLKVEHTAPLMARPLISHSLINFDATPTGRGGVTAMHWLDGTSQGDVLAFGTDSGALIKILFPSAAAAPSATAHPIETVQLFPEGSNSRIDSIAAGGGRLFVVSDSAGAALWLPESRCGRETGCVGCVALRDPRCSWRLDIAACVFAAEPPGLSNVSSGFHSGCPISSRNLLNGLPSSAPSTPKSVTTSVLPPRQLDSAAVAAATLNSKLNGVSGSGGVPVGTFVSVLIALCVLGFLIGFLFGFLLRRQRRQVKRRRDAVGAAAGGGDRAETEKCIDGDGGFSASADDVPLRRRGPLHGQLAERSAQHHHAVSNEYTEHPPTPAAYAAAAVVSSATPAAMRIVSSHSSALDSWQSCAADVPAIDDVDDDVDDVVAVRRGQPIGDHRDNDWRHI